MDSFLKSLNYSISDKLLDLIKEAINPIVIQIDLFGKAKKYKSQILNFLILKLFASPITGVSYQSENVIYVTSTPSNKKCRK